MARRMGAILEGKEFLAWWSPNSGSVGEGCTLCGPVMEEANLLGETESNEVGNSDDCEDHGKEGERW